MIITSENGEKLRPPIYSMLNMWWTLSGPIPDRKLNFRIIIGSQVRIPLPKNLFFSKTSFNSIHLKKIWKTKGGEKHIFYEPELNEKSDKNGRKKLCLIPFTINKWHIIENIIIKYEILIKIIPNKNDHAISEKIGKNIYRRFY